MTRDRILPGLLLATWIALFGAIALGASALGFDDHPGQLYRVWLVVTHGFAPWRWSAGWWAGYPELQFYPPVFAYTGALLHHASLGALSVAGAYHALVWLAWAAPGVTTYVLLVRVLGTGWGALPGAFVALTLSAGLASGVEGGVHVGMVAARLGWALLPLVVLVGLRVAESPWWAATAAIPLVALVALTHPAHAPAAAAALVLAAAISPHRPRRAVASALAMIGGGAALTAFWSLPLLVRAAETRALAWGSASEVFTSLARDPLGLGLVVLAAVARPSAGDAPARAVRTLPWVLIALLAVDGLVLEPVGIAWLPAHRLLDALALAIVLAAGVTVGRAVQRWGRRPWAMAGLAMLAVGAAVALSLPARSLTLWPVRGQWPALPVIEHGLRLPELWTRLRSAPEGRILFTRSSVPLVYGTAWWRPHTHATALTPQMTGREIVHGTFTHPSPIAALVYRGDVTRAPLRALAETLDGASLFGRPLADLDPAALARYADRLGISTIVVLEDDLALLALLDRAPDYHRMPAPPPFRIYCRSGVGIPTAVADGEWRIVPAHRDRAEAGPTWATMRVAYYPLWRAYEGDRELDTRRGELGELEVRVLHRDAPLTLRYGAGAAERLGTAVSALTSLVWVGVAIRGGRRRRSAP